MGRIRRPDIVPTPVLWLNAVAVEEVGNGGLLPGRSVTAGATLGRVVKSVKVGNDGGTRNPTEWLCGAKLEFFFHTSDTLLSHFY